MDAQASSLLMTVEWLARHLDSKELLIIDTRKNDDYRLGHIPGAINIPTDMTFASSGDTSRVGSLRHIQDLFSRNGINREDHIVVYDNGEHIDAARFFWVLEVYGHDHVNLLNGGMGMWQERHLPVETKTNQRLVTQYIPRINHHRITSRKAMELAINNSAISIIDARSEQEFNGLESRAQRKGHIPGAINIPSDRNLLEIQENLSTLLDDTQLVQQYEKQKGKQVITYCNKGRQSALTYFMLRQLGADVSVYDGAWLEWGNDPALPIE